MSDNVNATIDNSEDAVELDEHQTMLQSNQSPTESSSVSLSPVAEQFNDSEINSDNEDGVVENDQNPSLNDDNDDFLDIEVATNDKRGEFYQERTEVRKSTPIEETRARVSPAVVNSITENLNDISEPIGPPTCEINMDTSIITDLEIRELSEFFTGTSDRKTPERYCCIRNHILNMWSTTRPAHLRKTIARSELRGCGDVTVFGRVFDLLEVIGAINFGCPETVYKAHKPTLANESISRSDTRDKKRVRRVRNSYGKWEDENETISGTPSNIGAEEDRERIEKRRRLDAIEQQRLAALNSQYFATPAEDDSSLPQHKRASSILAATKKRSHHLTEFSLIPCRKYETNDSHNHGVDSTEAPFKIFIQPKAMLIMDLHAHLFHTEVIGLLGGKYQSGENAEPGELIVDAAWPCKSTSTTTQCELDAVSETIAREAFAEQGLSVVGWYHSHPTFSPMPSLRDIENQTNYQTLFSRTGGVEPFVGVIVCPYDVRLPSNVSLFNFISVSHEWDAHTNCRVPYSLEPTVVDSGSLPKPIDLERLIGLCSFEEHLVDLTSPFRYGGKLNRLDKLLCSLDSHIRCSNTITAQAFLIEVRRLLIELMESHHRS